jgi:hypothetical protein
VCTPSRKIKTAAGLLINPAVSRIVLFQMWNGRVPGSTQTIMASGIDFSATSVFSWPLYDNTNNVIEIPG